MPDKKPPATKKGFKPIWVVYGVGGAIAVYVAYRLYEDYAANQAAAGTTSGTPSTTDTTGTTSTSPATATSPTILSTPVPFVSTPLQSWISAALAEMAKLKKANGTGYISGNEALTGLQAYTSGVCVNQRQANAIMSVLRTVGGPYPAGTAILDPVVCKGTPGTTQHTDIGTTGHTPATHVTSGTGPGVVTRAVSTATARTRANDIAANARKRANQLAANARAAANRRRSLQLAAVQSRIPKGSLPIPTRR